MITEGLIVFLAGGLRLVVGLIPTWTPPATPFGELAVSLGSMAAQGNGYFPVAVLGVCLVLILGLKVALLAWRVVVFIWEVLPGKAT